MIVMTQILAMIAVTVTLVALTVVALVVARVVAHHQVQVEHLQAALVVRHQVARPPVVVDQAHRPVAQAHKADQVTAAKDQVVNASRMT